MNCVPLLSVWVFNNWHERADQRVTPFLLSHIESANVNSQRLAERCDHNYDKARFDLSYRTLRISTAHAALIQSYIPS